MEELLLLAACIFSAVHGGLISLARPITGTAFVVTAFAVALLDPAGPIALSVAWFAKPHAVHLLRWIAGKFGYTFPWEVS